MKNDDRPFPASDAEGIFYTVSDGTKIFVHTKLPDRKIMASVYILSGITGINHNSDKDMIEGLSGKRNRVVVIHPRGTGYSEGRRGDHDDFFTFLKDYIEIINGDLVSGKNIGHVILFGHSMSTAVVLYVAERIKKISGAILVNPPYRMKPSKGMTPSFGDYLKYALYFVFAPHKPIVNMTGRYELIREEHERKEAEARSRDPLLVKYFSLYSMMQSRKMIHAMLEKAKNADYPLLLLYGDQDSLVERSGCDEIFVAWKNPHKQFTLVAGGPHGKLTVLKSMETIQTWMEKL